MFFLVQEEKEQKIDNWIYWLIEKEKSHICGTIIVQIYSLSERKWKDEKKLLDADH